MPEIKSKEKTGELLFKFELGLFSGMCMSTTTPQTSTWYEGVSPTCISSLTKSSLGHIMLICNWSTALVETMVPTKTLEDTRPR